MAWVVITGGNRGIGLALARLYRSSGHQVIVGARQPEAATDVPEGVEVLALDIGEDTSVAGFADALAGRAVDLLINNAAVLGPARQAGLDTDFPGFLEALNVNTLGPLRVTQALLPNLRLATSAKVAVISSIMGSFDHAGAGWIAYRASKAALNKLSQSLAIELAEEGIALTILHPGLVRTGMGGPGAPLGAEESAAALKALIDELSLDTTGQFRNFDGSLLSG